MAHSLSQTEVYATTKSVLRRAGLYGHRTLKSKRTGANPRQTLREFGASFVAFSCCLVVRYFFASVSAVDADGFLSYTCVSICRLSLQAQTPMRRRAEINFNTKSIRAPESDFPNSEFR